VIESAAVGADCEHQAMRSNILILVGWGASGDCSERGDLMCRLEAVCKSKHSGLIYAKF
jgi:hypothetical protein